jgi:gamma-glutamyltranspeptidase/glutathione hydrolase
MSSVGGPAARLAIRRGTWAAGLLALALLLSCRGPAKTSAAAGPLGAIACDHPLAAQAGARVLARGGNAADAGVACALALAVVYPQAGNLGGGGFGLWVPRRGEALALDFRETAAGGARASAYRDAQGEPMPERAQSGAYSVGVPGSPQGLWELYLRAGSGRFTWAELCQSAVDLAREGFEVGADLARDLADPKLRARLEQSPAARERFYPGGAALEAGARLVQPDLARTLERLAREGPDGFYRGPVAQALVAELERSAKRDGLDPRGALSAEDLSRYRPALRAPLVGWFRGHEILTMPPPSAGGLILLQSLAILDGFPLSAQRSLALEARARAGSSALESDEVGVDARAAHWWIEALRSAFRVRAESLGDPDFVAVDVAALLAPEWVARARVQIGEAAGSGVTAEAREGDSTTHLSVIDGEGNALALTTTLNSTFGSGLLVEGAGFLLNNEIDDFSLGGGVPNQFGLVGSDKNAIAPNKRPLSSMTPTVVRGEDRSVRFVLGSPGGPRIPSALLCVLLRVLVFEQGLGDAVAAPRLHQQASPPATEFEEGWPNGLLEALVRRGHGVTKPGRSWGSVQALGAQQGGVIQAASDPRRNGAGIVVEAKQRTPRRPAD